MLGSKWETRVSLYTKQERTWFYALTTREAEFRIPGKSALFCCFLESFHPKFTSKIRKKKNFLSLDFSENCAKYLANILRQSEDLPKVCRKGQKRRRKSKSMPNSDSSLEFWWKKSCRNSAYKKKKVCQKSADFSGNRNSASRVANAYYRKRE